MGLKLYKKQRMSCHIIVSLLILTLIISLSGCASSNHSFAGNRKTDEPTEQIQQTSLSPTVDPMSENTQDQVYPESSASDAGEMINSPEITAEHLSLIEEATSRLLALLDTEQALLEKTSVQMLQLQHTAVEESDWPYADSQRKMAWKSPYYRDSELIWELGSDEETTALLDETRSALIELSASSAFTQAFPTLNSLILEGDICQYRMELVDSVGNHFCAVTLNYCEQVTPEVHPYYTLEWINAHWFLYVEWHE